VIAPNLNEEKHLPVFLNSLVNQTLQDFEVIIVDGGSTDNSLKIIGKYRKKLNIKVVVDTIPNFGYIRNVGALQSNGDLLFNLNCDNYLPPYLLQEVRDYYSVNRGVVSVSGRVYPLHGGLIAQVGYQLFDLLRWAFTCAPCPIKKYRPSGNFMTIKRDTFFKIGGYPHATVNEDGLLGQKLDPVLRVNHKAVMFNLKLYVGHYPKKFNDMGGVHALLFYFYTLGNFAPMLNPLLEPIRRNASNVFQHKQVDRTSVFKRFMKWL
jgi:glycosyltransferase involved in cell wall biosynthesis